MTVWRVLTQDEIDAHYNHPEEVARREYEAKHAHRQRPHCSHCGRFGRYVWRYFDCAGCGMYRID